MCYHLNMYLKKYIIKNIESYLDMKQIIAKRLNREFYVKIEYPKTKFGQKFIDFLGPNNFNLMPVNIKKGSNRNIQKEKV